MKSQAGKAGKVGKFEVYAARVWNILNEGKSFYIVFSLFILIIVSLLNKYSFLGVVKAIAITIPLFIIFFYFDFPLKFRYLLWVLLAVHIIMFQYINVLALILILAIYFFFTVIFWGSIYYHIRMGIPLTNFKRFWKLVLENSDSTSGNFLEQFPKAMITVTTVLLFIEHGYSRIISVSMFVILVLVYGIVANKLFFMGVVKKEKGKKTEITNKTRLTSKVYIIVIDGCRRDKLMEADTPTIGLLKHGGVEYIKMRTTYPSRTVVCFSSMFTGAPKEKHGIKNNLVIASLFGREGTKCESIFDVLERNKLKGSMVGIAHLQDAFGKHVKTVSAKQPNDTVDRFIMEKTKELIDNENPDLVVTQLISTDQTGHALGTSYKEYIQKIKEADILIKDFLDYLKNKNLLEKSTIMIMSDHGQSYRGIGGHGHWDKGEKYVPFIMYGKAVKRNIKIGKPVTILSIAPTISYLLGVEPPEESIGEVLIGAINK